MRDDFDSAVANRFNILDRVPVPDTWSRIREIEEVSTMLHVDSSSPTLDLETAVPTGPPPNRPMRVLVAGIMAAAAVAAMVFVATRDSENPADEPSPTTTVPAPPSPRALFGTPDEQFAPGTYFVNEVEGHPTPRILVTIDAGWTNTVDGWGIGQDNVGFITFSRPDSVFLDACHSAKGYHPGPLTTLDGLVAALSEQAGWVDVTAPTDISVSGYDGQAFQRTAPAEFGVCNGAFAPFRSWENVDDDGNKGWSYYEPGETETLWVLDVDGTIIIINARTGSDQPPAAHTAFAAVLDTIRIDPSPRALFGTPDEQFAPGTYFVNEVEGHPTPRILVTIDAGWTNTVDGWGIGQDNVGFITFSRPDSVFLDACHSAKGYHPGPLTTLDGLVAALSEQAGWVDVTAPTDISVSGYDGQAFQRTAPAEFGVCNGAFAPFRSWENVDDDGNKGWSYYEPGETETLWVLDVDGTIIIINARTGSDQPPAAHTAFAAVLDTIRIDRS